MSASSFDMNLIFLIIIFIGAIAQDLLWRKVKNQYVLAALTAVFLFQVSNFGLVPSLLLLPNVLFALLLGLIFYKFKILGAGDVKIFAAVAMLLSIEGIITALICSFVWGSLLGVIRYLLSGQVQNLFANMLYFFNKDIRKGMKMQPIPFTVALLFGILTEWVLRKHGLGIL